MTDQLFDVVVVGAGPAGATAATRLAQLQRSVCMVDRAEFPRAAACAGWLNARAKGLLESLRVPIRSVLAEPFTEVTFHNAEFTKRARPSFSEAPGFLIDRTAFDNLLVEGAVASGVDLRSRATVVGVDQFEDRVVIHIQDDAPVCARLVILATGRGTPLMEKLGVRRAPGRGTIHTGLAERETGSISAAGPRVGVVLGLDRHGSFAMSVSTLSRTSISLCWYGAAAAAQVVFVQVCRALYEHEAVAVNLSERAASCVMSAGPAFSALDMDSHVAKNGLVIGDAGGFVAAASREGIYPAMWSGEIGADVIHAALDSRHPQDALMAFESRWRHAMADYLRAPNTDLHFLLPLIFSNQAMADRMGAAFFSGENL